MKRARSIRPALTWTGDRFESDVTIGVGPDGSIESIHRTDDPGADLVLDDQALLPGFVNAHSHSFQRAMRGRTETFPSGKGSFWTWREAMYELVKTIDEEELYDWNLAAFREMRGAGITTVGEFHYLHHLDTTARDHRFDEVVLRAAEDAGIRLVLLLTYYKTGGPGQPLSDAQERFATPDIDAFLRQVDRLQNRLSALQSVGLVAHSIRAVPLHDLERLAAAAIERDLPFHMHLEEQRREIEESRVAYGEDPMSLVLRHTAVDEHFTGVHCTHTSEANLREWLGRGANVCMTPLTEGNLGDGVQPLAELASGQLAVGTDCNARIDVIEELRWLEYVQRLRREDRGVFRDGQGNNGRTLLEIGTKGGAGSLRIRAGEIVVGRKADFLTVDLRNPAVRGWTEDTLLDSIIFGGGNEVIARTCVGGRWA